MSVFFVFLAGLFTASGNSLLLNSVSLDYETTPVYNVTVSATDNGSPPLSVQVCDQHFVQGLAQSYKWAPFDIFCKM